ncbi:MAG TPA: hypothetical protein VJP85_01580 [Candidatus Baltobacteraceae bacterium]|nr:hypothetical protein [Candidatus Baltobacteraceae bacterium]
MLMARASGWDVVALQARRITEPIPAFVVLSDDFGDGGEGLVTQENVLPELGVILNRAVLVRRQAARLDENAVRNEQFSDVVQQTRLQNLGEVLAFELEIALGPMLGHRVYVHQVHASKRIAVEQTVDDRLDAGVVAVQLISADIVFADGMAALFAAQTRAVLAYCEQFAARCSVDRRKRETAGDGDRNALPVSVIG